MAYSTTERTARRSLGQQLLFFSIIFLIVLVATLQIYGSVTNFTISQIDQQRAITTARSARHLFQQVTRPLATLATSQEISQTPSTASVGQLIQDLPQPAGGFVLATRGASLATRGPHMLNLQQIAKIEHVAHNPSLRSGIVKTAHGLVIVAVYPIAHAQSTWAIYGRPLNIANLRRVGDILQSHISVLTTSGQFLSTGGMSRQALHPYLSQLNVKDVCLSQRYQHSGYDRTTVETILPGFNGMPVGVIGIMRTTPLAASVSSDLARVTWLTAVALVLIVGLLMVTIQRRVIGPLRYFLKALEAITDGSYHPQKAPRILRHAEHEIIQAFERISRLAYRDTLTDTPNRAAFESRLSSELESARRHHRHLAILFIDLDRFKLINDALGHRAGDQVLQATSSRLQTVIGAENLYRFGGDEFLAIMPTPLNHQDVEVLAEQVLRSFDTPLNVGSEELFIAASIGGSMFPEDGDNSDDLIRHADAAMYAAKADGRNQFVLYCTLRSEGRPEGLDNLRLENDLHRAIERDELFLLYQPEVDANTGQILSVEALVRWNHPTLGLIAPANFIPLAEESGLILAIGDWVCYQACSQAKRWQEAGLSPVSVAVNVSPRQLEQLNFIQRIRDILRDTQMDPQYLILEITESVIVRPSPDITTRIQQIRDMGIRIAIDDFGTGYSSLSYLEQLPIDALKIDRSFVRNIRNAQDGAVAKTIINLAHHLRLQVIAEGVETANQLAILQQHGCDVIQGYIIHPPLSPDDVAVLLKDGACCLPKGHSTDDFQLGL